MTINGLPLHPLIVHATVVVLPLFAVLCVAYVRPIWATRLRLPLLITAVVAAGLTWLTSASGDALRDDRFGRIGGVLAERIEHHEQLAGYLAIAAYALAAVAVLVSLLRHRLPTALVGLGSVLLVAGSFAVLVLVVLTGHAGAEAAWAQ